MDLERFDRILRWRMWISASLYAIFIGVGLHGVITGWHYDNPTPAVLLLVAAFLICPRRAEPKDWEPDPDSAQDQLEVQARELVQRRLNKVRLFYFFAAFFLLALLPHFLGEPVFLIFG